MAKKGFQHNNASLMERPAQCTDLKPIENVYTHATMMLLETQCNRPGTPFHYGNVRVWFVPR
ncbi:unnamed protein product, partial [Ceratitis capitata]